MSKPYGLIVSGKSKAAIANAAASAKRPSIFDEDSESGDEPERPTGLKTTLKRQDRVVQEKAVEQDPTVYQYDEIYDEMEQKRKESKLSRKDLDKKPKYINKLLEAANRRKQENERRIERQVQKEREAEGDEFKDKEAFVTTAYRKKLEEMKKLEEEEQREEYLESIGDVRKQGNLDGFYRHLYDQKVNFEVEPGKSGNEDTAKNPKKRKYRKHEDNSNSEDEPEVKMEHLPSNLDADSDFSIDSGSDESDAEDDAARKAKVDDVAVKDVAVADPVQEAKADDVKSEEATDVKSEDVKEEVKPKTPKIDIWKKRTVGVVFDEALQRYFERKALREAGN